MYSLTDSVCFANVLSATDVESGRPTDVDLCISARYHAPRQPFFICHLFYTKLVISFKIMFPDYIQNSNILFLWVIFIIMKTKVDPKVCYFGCLEPISENGRGARAEAVVALRRVAFC